MKADVSAMLLSIPEAPAPPTKEGAAEPQGLADGVDHGLGQTPEGQQVAAEAQGPQGEEGEDGSPEVVHAGFFPSRSSRPSRRRRAARQTAPTSAWLPSPSRLKARLKESTAASVA